MKLACWRNGRRGISGDDGITTENAVVVQFELHHCRKSVSVRGLGFGRDFHNLIEWMPHHRLINKF
jgi:hypothetical protein